MNSEEVDERREVYDWSALAGELGWDEIRRRFQPDRCDAGQAFARIWPRHVPGRPEPIETVNRWNVERAYQVFLLNLDDKRVGYCQNYWAARLDALFDTIRARRAVLPDAEMKAFVALLDHLDDSQARDYVVSNCFMERGPRSGLLYMFRRGLPILTFRTSDESVEPRAALCLHPLAYYEGTHAGALPPSDELLALLLMMRADELYLWRKANQLDIRDPMVAV